MLKISEADLEKYGTDLLALDGWRSLKTDPVSRKEWGKGFGERGMADRLYIRYGRNSASRVAGLCEVLWIEWKRSGGKASSHQLRWIFVERTAGALVWLAGKEFEATPEGFAEHYRESGLLRKPGLC